MLWGILCQKPKPNSTLLDESCAYTKTPIRCVVSLRKLLKQVRGLLPQVQVPIWIGQGKTDGVVHPRSAVFIQERTCSQVKQLHYYEEYSHGLLLDQERERVYADISGFIVSLEVAYYGVKETDTAIEKA